MTDVLAVVLGACIGWMTATYLFLGIFKFADWRLSKNDVDNEKRHRSIDA